MPRSKSPNWKQAVEDCVRDFLAYLMTKRESNEKRRKKSLYSCHRIWIDLRIMDDIDKTAGTYYEEAQKNLALLFDGDYGLPQNSERAAELFKLVADQGNDFARLRLDQVGNKESATLFVDAWTKNGRGACMS